MTQPHTTLLAACLALLATSSRGSDALDRSSCVDRLRGYSARIPPLYRIRDDSDLIGYWRYVLEEYGFDPSCTIGDFDGDGKPDVAALLIRKDGLGFALWVFPSSGPAANAAVMLREEIGTFEPQDARVAPAKAGEYERFSGCDIREVPRHVALRHTAIDYFARKKDAPASSRENKPEHWLFYWDDAHESFLSRSLCNEGDWSRQ